MNSKKEILKINIPSRKDEAPKTLSENVSIVKSISQNKEVSPVVIEGQYPFDYPSRHQPIEDQSPTVLKELVSKIDDKFPPDDYPVNMWVKLFRFLKNRMNTIFANHESRLVENEDSIENAKQDIDKLKIAIGDGTGDINLSDVYESISNIEVDVNTNKTSITGLTQSISDITDILEDVSNTYVAKSGDTMTGTLSMLKPFSCQLNNNEIVKYKALNIDINVIPTGAHATARLQDVYDKNNVALMQQYFRREMVTGCMALLVKINQPNNVAGWFNYKVYSDGTSFAEYPSPYPMQKNEQVVNCGYLNNALGTGASLTALASIDEIAENYVETLEIKKQKAIVKINAEVQQSIYSGFNYNIDGKEYHIDYSLFDQVNLANLSIVASQNINEIIPFRCTDTKGNVVWLNVLGKVVVDIHKYGIVQHQNTIRMKADNLKTKIMRYSVEEIDKFLSTSTSTKR